jgi:maleate isomerase
MMHRFGVLIPPANTTAEVEYNRLLPPTLQAHIGRIPLLGASAGSDPRRGDEDVECQARMLGSAGIEVISLAETSASLLADDYDEIIIKRLSEASGVPAVTAGQAIGHAVQAWGARRIALVAPVALSVLEREKHYYETRYGLEVVALEAFSRADPPDITGPERVRRAIARVTRPDIEIMIIRGGGNVATMALVTELECVFGKPVITPNQAALWAMLHIIKFGDRLTDLGKLLREMPIR